MLPRTFLTEIVIPELQITFARKLTSRGLHILFERSHAINGHGEIAQDFVNVLENLTHHHDLKFLTLLTWSEILASQGLLRHQKAWCSECYREGSTSSCGVYDQLIWSIKLVKICPKHRIPLSENCPHCKQTMPSISWRSRVGFCSKCSESLVSQNSTRLEQYDDRDQDYWMAHSISDLLAKTPNLQESPSKNIIRVNLIDAVEILARGNIALFASWLKTPKNTFWGWYKGKSFPTLKSLMEIAWILDISLLDLVTQKLEFQTLRENCRPAGNQTRSKRLSPKIFDSQGVQETLIQVLHQYHQDIPTIKEIANNLGYEPRLITRHFPGLCHAIVSKRRNLKKINHDRTIQDCCQEVEQAVITLYGKGQYPTEARVSKMISRPGFLRYKKVRASFRQARRQLRLES